MGEGFRVLVVDDNAMSRELAHDVLEGSGWMVEEAANVEDAVTHLGVRVPDLVVLDWHLKGSTGAEVMVSLRQLPHRPRVLVVTADARPELRRAAQAAGADDVLTKPYRAAQLVDAASGLVQTPWHPTPETPVAPRRDPRHEEE